jgi:hypothetical protein
VRLWTLHPRYLDARGLSGLWREALLAQTVLLGGTRGYRNHPQLTRFRQHPDPPQAIATYLIGVHAESLARGYRFDASRIRNRRANARLVETDGQLSWEWGHLKAKLRARSPEVYASLVDVRQPEAHPMFDIVAGPVEPWEKIAGAATNGE